MDVKALWRYPVKSMAGQRVDECEVGPIGLAGDRAFAVLDAVTGKVASAKHPRKWGALLQFAAAYPDGQVGSALITMPTGEQVSTADPDADARLSAALGAEVVLAAVPPPGPTYEAEWPDIDGVIPADFLAATRTGPGQDGGTMTALRVKEGTFQDSAAVHLLADATLAHLAGVAPGSVFDVRRFRPNIVVGGAPGGFVENRWMGSPIHVGEVVLTPLVQTMRCVMTTLAQADLPADRGTLRAIATYNKVEIPGLGTWSCAGLYAEVAQSGRVRVGDPFIA